MNNILKINKLNKKYHDMNGEIEAIKDITLDIYNNEFISIVGPSGCGKSSLLSILAGIEEKSYGELIFNKDNLKIGYMLQKDSLFPWRTILDNCLIGLEIEGKLTNEKKENVILLLKKYGLQDFIDKYPSSLSGGMRQRV
ncbi:MAG: ATP-binding cassette domain-containing protein, partial [Bacilli bacterium]|nr:ATP-binding cassette domain-containing protein [Bacilli bacterium]